MGNHGKDNDSDQEVSTEHSKLLEAVSKLDKGQRVKKPERNEPSIQVSEFHLVKSGVTDKDAIKLDDLIKTLKNKPHHREITNKFKNTKQKTKVLPKPLEKPQAERLKREVGYENAKKEVQRWDAIITRNRAAPSLNFPLSRPSFIQKATTDEFVKRFRIQSELEKQMAALEPQEQRQDDDKDEKNFPLTLGEILERRREASKFRAQQSYKEAKAHRQNKIKSKKFHRIQRKEKIKQQLKEFEALKKSDPEAALEKLEQLDRTRAEERMSLRHKSTGQWAKNKLVRAKYDAESRKVLAQQLSISKELTQKIRKDEESEEEDEEKSGSGDNPWSSGKTETEIDEFISGYRKYWEANKKDEKQKEGDFRRDEESGVPDSEARDLNPVEEVIEERILVDESSKREEGVEVAKAKFTSEWKVETFPSAVDSSEVEVDGIFQRLEENIQRKANKKMKKARRNLRTLGERANEESVGEENVEDDVFDLSFRNTKRKAQFDRPLEETREGEGRGTSRLEGENVLRGGITGGGRGSKRGGEIDPTKFIAVKPKHLKTQLPDDVGGGEGAMDDSDGEEAQFNIISEAFAEDDVVDEFRKDKEDEIKKSEPEDIDLRLPGWGTWGGKNIKNNPRKKRRFILKFPKEAPRKDENKGDVIIIEDGNSKIKEHLVTEIPYPFTSVADYEASIRAPIGRNFVPENAHKRLIEPSVKTRLGTIIPPMDEDVLLSRDIKIRGKLQEKDKQNGTSAKDNNRSKKKIKNVKKQKKIGKPK